MNNTNFKSHLYKHHPYDLPHAILPYSDRLILPGIAPVMAGLVIVLFIPFMANPRTGLSAQTEGSLNGKLGTM